MKSLANRRTIIREPRPQTYWSENGLYQGQYEYLQHLKHEDFKSFKNTFENVFKGPLNAHNPFSQDALISNVYFTLYADWKFFDAIMGIYYGYHNDGDNAERAIENNRTPYGSDMKSAMSKILNDPYAPQSGKAREAVYDYLYGRTNSPEELMNEIVLFYHDEDRLPSQMRAKRSERSIGCRVCGRVDSLFATQNPNDGYKYCGQACLKKQYK